jgi:hypothetical protein
MACRAQALACPLARVAPWFIRTEFERRAFADFWLPEVKGRWPVPGLPQARGITLVGKADRIDRLPDGRIAIYDYKSGKPPTEKEERSFSKQLWLEAAMAADGAFGDRTGRWRPRASPISAWDPPRVSSAHDPTPRDRDAEIRVPPLLAHFTRCDIGLPVPPRGQEHPLGRGLRPPRAPRRVGRDPASGPTRPSGRRGR